PFHEPGHASENRHEGDTCRVRGAGAERGRRGPGREPEKAGSGGCREAERPGPGGWGRPGRGADAGRAGELPGAGPGSRCAPGRWGLRGSTAGEVTCDRSAWRSGSTFEFHFDGHAASKVEFEGLAM